MYYVYKIGKHLSQIEHLTLQNRYEHVCTIISLL